MIRKKWKVDRGKRIDKMSEDRQNVIPAPYVIPAKAGIYGINSSRNPEKKLKIKNENEKLKFWILDCHFAFCSLNFELKNDMETR